MRSGVIIIGGGVYVAGLLAAITALPSKPIIIVNNEATPVKEPQLPQPVEKEYVPMLGDLTELKSYEKTIARWMPKLGHPKRKTNKLRCKHNAKLKRR